MSIIQLNRRSVLVSIGILTILALGGVATVSISMWLKKDPPPANTITALRFYSASLSQDVRIAIYEWLKTKDVSSFSLDTISVQPATYQETVQTVGDEQFKQIRFVLDIKNPSVSYQVETLVPRSYTSKSGPLYITCPEPRYQRGDANNCQGMTEL